MTCWHTVLLLLHSGNYSLIHNFQALASRRGLTLGSHAQQHRRLQGVQVPEVHGPLHQEGLVAAPSRHPRYRDRRAHSESPAAWAQELRYRAKASAELAPPTCYADLEVYSARRPTWRSSSRRTRPSLLPATRCGYVPPKELRLRLTHHERASVMGGLSCIFQPFAQANNPWARRTTTPRSPSAKSRTWTSTPCARPQ